MFVTRWDWKLERLMYAVDSSVKYLYALGQSWVLRVVLVHGQLDIPGIFNVHSN